MSLKFREESVHAVVLVPHKRVQQPIVEETVEVGRLASATADRRVDSGGGQVGPA